MKGNLKRVFQAMFMMLATVMLLSIPVSAASSKTVATIGSKSYTSLDAAVKKVKKGQTIKLKKDVTVSSLTLNRNVKYTINLNGHKLTCKNSSGKINIKKGTVTIKNGSLGYFDINVYKNASVTLSSIKINTYNTIQVKKKGKLTIKSGTYSIDQILNYGTTTIKKATFSGRLFNWKAATMSIKDGKFSGTVGDLVSNYGTATISGGTFNAKGDNTVYNQGTMKIKAGTFKYSNTKWGGRVIDNSGTMNISGGRFTVAKGCSKSGYACQVIWNQAGGKLTVKGGTFENLVTSKYNGSKYDSGYDVVYNYQFGNKTSFTMTGGTLKASSPNGYDVFNKYGTVNITGGTLSSAQTYKIYNNGSLHYSGVKLTDKQIYNP